MVLFVLLVTLLPLFFYQLGASSLVSWDEAWYAEVGRQIGITGNWLVMRFNQEIFMDHPPVGFWLIHIGQLLFGVNEFGSRFMGAVFGIITVTGTYLLGSKLFSRRVGFFAALALVSAPWFLLRSRSGNLDIYLMSGLVWSVYLAVRARTERKYFIPLVLVGGLTLLTKTVAPLMILPAIFWAMLGSKKYKWYELFGGILVVVGMFWVWTNANATASDIFWQRYLFIGTPGVGEKLDMLSQIKLIKDHVYNGIGRWFWPAVLASGLGLFSFKWKYWLLIIASAGLIGPYLFSGRAQLWHLIQAQPFLLLTLMAVVSGLSGLVLQKKIAVLAVMTGLFGLIGLPLLDRSWRENVANNPYRSDEQVLAEASRQYPGKMYVDETFVPAVVFYSHKRSEKVLGPLEQIFQEKPRPFVLITYDWRIANINPTQYPYEIVLKDRDKVLVVAE